MFVHFTDMSLTPELSDVASIEDVVVQRMVALFDYDPWESSPNMDSEVSHIMTHISSYSIAYPWFVCDQFAEHISFSFFFLFFPKGWTRLPCRWHHIRVRWHGSGWILLCECQCTHNSEVVVVVDVCWNYVASLTFFSILGRSVRTSRFGSI